MLNESEIYYVNSFNLQEVDNWDKIDYCKSKTFIDSFPSIKYLRFPGFITDYAELFDWYEQLVYHKTRHMFTPPRGNISTQCNLMIIGIKPGSRFANYSVSECSWLLGPSSKMLNKLLENCNVYPYFTNMFHTKDADENNINDSFILDEINFMHAINRNISVVCLGTYPVYDYVRHYCLSSNINFEIIWHPSYLCRSYNENKFNIWCNKLKQILAKS